MGESTIPSLACNCPLISTLSLSFTVNVVAGEETPLRFISCVFAELSSMVLLELLRKTKNIPTIITINATMRTNRVHLNFVSLTGTAFAGCWRASNKPGSLTTGCCSKIFCLFSTFFIYFLDWGDFCVQFTPFYSIDCLCYLQVFCIHFLLFLLYS